MNEYFKQNQGKFDVYELKSGHTDRFLQKLEKRQKPKIKGFSIQKWMIAASILLLVGLAFSYVRYDRLQSLQNDEVQQSERYFSMIIQDEIQDIKKENTTETNKVFEDALHQIQDLEIAYQKLVKDYRVNKDKFILNAMIENFQQRIEILQFVKQQIKEIKQTKTYHNEENRA